MPMEIDQDKTVSAFIKKFTVALLCIALLALFVSYARAVVIPVIFAILFGIVLRPVEKFINVKMHVPRVLAILITTILFLLIVLAILFLAMYEITRFLDDLPTLKMNFNMHVHTFRVWAMNHLHIPYQSQEKYIDSATSQTIGNTGNILNKTIDSLQGIFTSVIVVPVLLFLVLYYRTLFLDFIIKAFGTAREELMKRIIADTKFALQGYVAGLFLEMLSVTILQTTVMWAIGIDYPLFIGLITGVLNMIPYLGILIAGSLGILISLATGADLTHIIYLVLGFMTVQFVDNNILLPKLVGSRVSINAFFSIVGVLFGGVICGIAGMFLSIPMMALLKVILDNIDHLKPWGTLMGDHLPKTVKWKRIRFPKID
jgi:predicted PurR-regulated permease PerM